MPLCALSQRNCPGGPWPSVARSGFLGRDLHSVGRNEFSAPDLEPEASRGWLLVWRNVRQSCCLPCLSQPQGLEKPLWSLKLLPYIGSVSRVFSVLSPGRMIYVFLSCLCFDKGCWGLWRTVSETHCLKLTTDYDHKLDQVNLSDIDSPLLSQLLLLLLKSWSSVSFLFKRSSGCPCWQAELSWILEKFREVLNIWRITLKKINESVRIIGINIASVYSYITHLNAEVILGHHGINKNGISKMLTFFLRPPTHFPSLWLHVSLVQVKLGGKNSILGLWNTMGMPGVQVAV